jgi:AcrR family transcriptional regulator
MAKQDAKERIVEAAFALFAERGYDATTVDDIAERAGVGRTTFFRTFRAKEDVIFPDHDELIARVESRLKASTQETSLLAISEASRLVLLQYLDEGDLARGRYALTSTVPALRDREIASAQQYRLVFKQFILDWLGDEPQAELRADLMAAVVVTAHNHVLRRWLRRQTTRPEEEFDAAMAEVGALFAERREEAQTSVVVLRSDQDVDTLLPFLRSALKAAEGADSHGQ